MPVLFKDFDKDAKDLLTKQFGTAWKLESKFKGPKNALYVNPQADKNGVNVDVQYDCTVTGLKLKANVNAASQVKPKVTYEHGGNKVEVSTVGDVRELDYQVDYELKEKGFAASAQLTKKAVEASAVVSVAHHCVVGAGVKHDLTGKNKLSYSVGTRYNAQGAVLSALTNGFTSYSVGVLKGIKVAGKDWKVATKVNYGKAIDCQVGAEFPCILCDGNTNKVRVDNNLNFAVAVTRKLADGWKASLAWETGKEQCCQFGLQLVRE